MEYWTNVKGKDVLKLLNKRGYEVDRVKGSHHILKKTRNDGTVSTIVVPVNCRYLPPKALKYIVTSIAE